MSDPTEEERRAYRDKLRSVGFLGGRSRHGDGYHQATTDELGNTVTEHWSGRRDVTVRPPRVAIRTGEERDPG